MAAFVTTHTLHGSQLRSKFLGQDLLIHSPPTHSHRQHFTVRRKPATTHTVQPCAKFNLLELMGGRGLCNGEQGLEQELTRQVDDQVPPMTDKEQESSGSSAASPAVPEDAFDKEMMGLTGGFPGGEKGLKKFVEENPPPKNSITDINLSKKKPKPPELPLLLPGMIAIVKNPNNPFHMYCGIVQRITDGKAGVLFEGGNWDRLITFRLEELERREKGPPMKNPKSAVLEPFLENKS